MLRHFCIAIAFSQNAQSRQVAKLIRTPVFREAFANFDTIAVADANAHRILARYWPVLRPIRFRGKIRSILGCARGLVKISAEHGSFARYLRSFAIPRRLYTAADLDAFWRKFDILQADLRIRGMPFFRSTTSLLQLLLDLDYDAVKPDLIVMRLAHRIGLVPSEKGDLMFRQAARLIQQYAVDRALRPSQVDLALLAFGGQTNARLLLRQVFCPATASCDCTSSREVETAQQRRVCKNPLD